MLEIQNLHVEVGGRPVLFGVDLTLPEGETHVLFGRNGSGKTSLLMSIMGFEDYRITKGSISYRGKEISHLGPDERARLGIGIMFQRPPTIRGLSMGQLVALCAGEAASAAEVTEMAGGMGLAGFLEREVNLGFSGGEIKRSELLQLLAQNPEVVLLDEPESGVDLESINLVGAAIKRLLQKERHRRREKSGLIITHTGHILDYLEADRGYVMCDGRITCTGIARELLEDIRAMGYEGCMRCEK